MIGYLVARSALMDVVLVVDILSAGPKRVHVRLRRKSATPTGWRPKGHRFYVPVDCLMTKLDGKVVPYEKWREAQVQP